MPTCPSPAPLPVAQAAKGARAQALRRAENLLDYSKINRTWLHVCVLQLRAGCAWCRGARRGPLPPAARILSRGCRYPGGFLAVPSTFWGRGHVSQAWATCVTAPAATPARQEPCTWQEPRGTGVPVTQHQRGCEQRGESGWDVGKAAGGSGLNPDRTAEESAPWVLKAENGAGGGEGARCGDGDPGERGRPPWSCRMWLCRVGAPPYSSPYLEKHFYSALPSGATALEVPPGFICPPPGAACPLFLPSPSLAGTRGAGGWRR